MEKAVSEWKAKKEESMEGESSKTEDEPEENIYAVAAESDVSTSLESYYGFSLAIDQGLF